MIYNVTNIILILQITIIVCPPLSHECTRVRVELNRVCPNSLSNPFKFQWIEFIVQPVISRPKSTHLFIDSIGFAVCI